MPERSSRGPLYQALLERGVSRRAFLRFSAAMTAALALPPVYLPQVVRALEQAPRIPVIWREGQDCAGNTEAFLRASDPGVTEILLDILSVDYHEVIMAPSGLAAEASMLSTMENYPDGYLLVVEGSIPTAEGGVYCTIGGRTFESIVREVAEHALAVIAVGSCAFDGGLPAAGAGPTGAVGVQALVPGARIINLPGCPMNPANLTATIVHYLTFGRLPATDVANRPYFAYGKLIHEQCERRAHYERGEFVTSWNDEGARKGWCLYKMGCKGPATLANCPTVRFNEGTSWPVKAGHGCVGCTMSGFWDQMSPFYRRLPATPGFASDVTADQLGLGLVAVVGGLAVAHGAASYARRRRAVARERMSAVPALAAPTAERPAATAETPVSPEGSVPSEAPAGPEEEDEEKPEPTEGTDA